MHTLICSIVLYCEMSTHTHGMPADYTVLPYVIESQGRGLLHVHVLSFNRDDFDKEVNLFLPLVYLQANLSRLTFCVR